MTSMFWNVWEIMCCWLLKGYWELLFWRNSLLLAHRRLFPYVLFLQLWRWHICACHNWNAVKEIAIQCVRIYMYLFCFWILGNNSLCSLHVEHVAELNVTGCRMLIEKFKCLVALRKAYPVDYTLRLKLPGTQSINWMLLFIDWCCTKSKHFN